MQKFNNFDIIFTKLYAFCDENVNTYTVTVKFRKN